MKILITDKSKTNKLVEKNIIKSWFAQNLEIGDLSIKEGSMGSEVIDKIIHEEYDVAFLSMYSFDIDGLQIIDMIKEKQSELSTKIYIVSSSADKNLEQKLLEHGAAGLLKKPLQQEQVYAVLDEFVKNMEKEEEFLFDFDDFDDFDLDADTDNEHHHENLPSVLKQHTITDELMDQFNQSHKNLSAQEFIKTLINAPFYEKQLQNVHKEYIHTIDNLPTQSLDENINQILTTTNTLVKIVNSMKVFKELLLSLNIFKELLHEFQINILPKQESITIDAEFLDTLLQSMLEDLCKWIDLVFVQKVAVDIFYINASSLNNCIQIENFFKTLFHQSQKPKTYELISEDTDYLWEFLSDYSEYAICSETDLEGKITYVSKGFCKRTGYDKAELLGKSHSIVRDDSSDPKIFINMWEKLNNDETVSIDYLANKDKDGKNYYVQSFIKPIFIQGKKVGYRSLFKDITDEIEIKSMNALLEANNMSLHHTNQNLKKSIQEKEKNFTLFKEDFISLFTHELKTPLNAIINFSEYIHKNLQKPLTEKKQEKLCQLSEKIYNNGMNQQDMINTLLKFATIQAGRLSVHMKYIKLKDVFDEVAHRYLGLYNKEIVFDIDDFNVYADPQVCSMIFTNLLTNALKYSKSKVKVSAKKTDQENFFIAVEDDGEGIKLENRSKVFEMFSQSNEQSVLKMEKSGTGIGLYTVKLLVNICNKEISVTDSTDLGGAKFIIEGKVMNND